MSAAGHEHPPAKESAGGFDWFAWLDILVWVSVVVIAALALEWFWGKVIRERLAGEAQRYMANVRPGGQTE
jgi:hypothetical protein